MADLTSTSTIDDIVAAYVDNSTYDVDGSIAKARLFVQACRILLVKMPKMSSQDRASTSLNPEMVQASMKSALEWLSANGGMPPVAQPGGQVRIASLRNLRDTGGDCCRGSC